MHWNSPLRIWVVLLASIFLGERLTRLKLGIAALGFVGVLVVARPEINALNIGIIAAAVAAIGFAGAAILTRKLTVQNSLTKILFFLTGLQILFGLICAGFDGDIALPSSGTLPWLILIGVAGLAGTLLHDKISYIGTRERCDAG